MRTLGATLILFAALSAQAKEQTANMNLVLAVDVSESIGEPDWITNVREFSLMKKGIATALKDKAVGDALEQCNDRGVAITIFEWSGKWDTTQLKDVVPWTLAANRQTLHQIADRYAAAPRSFGDGSTDLDRALEHAHGLLDKAPPADRNVVLVSSDGRQNIYERSLDRAAPKVVVSETRDQLVAKGATIDALVIQNDNEDLRNYFLEPLSEWYGEHVIGGPGAFVKPVEDFEGYAQGMRAMLLRELSRCGY